MAQVLDATGLVVRGADRYACALRERSGGRGDIAADGAAGGGWLYLVAGMPNRSGERLAETTAGCRPGAGAAVRVFPLPPHAGVKGDAINDYAALKSPARGRLDDGRPS